MSARDRWDSNNIIWHHMATHICCLVAISLAQLRGGVKGSQGGVIQTSDAVGVGLQREWDWAPLCNYMKPWKMVQHLHHISLFWDPGNASTKEFQIWSDMHVCIYSIYMFPIIMWWILLLRTSVPRSSSPFSCTAKPKSPKRGDQIPASLDTWYNMGLPGPKITRKHAKRPSGPSWTGKEITTKCTLKANGSRLGEEYVPRIDVLAAHDRR